MRGAQRGQARGRTRPGHAQRAHGRGHQKARSLGTTADSTGRTILIRASANGGRRIIGLKFAESPNCCSVPSAPPRRTVSGQRASVRTDGPGLEPLNRPSAKRGGRRIRPQQILDCHPRSARGDWRCAGNTQLRQRVERLLAAHAEASGPLEQPIPLALLPDAHHALTGRRLGRWRLLEEIGRGGMSVVYRAVADEGDAAGHNRPRSRCSASARWPAMAASASRTNNRRARCMLPDAVVRDGVAEDGSVAGDGVVEGERIDAWCEQRGLGVEARVRLIGQVCGALAYAHRNLVIHRDIKPSNVLVDHDGHVRLLDFGIARLADDAGDERTATAMRALTPEYAAPEQFAGALPSTTMDVYGLAHCCTGCWPNGRRDRATASVPARRPRALRARCRAPAFPNQSDASACSACAATWTRW